ncbi:MAG: glutamine amidotransferase [Thermomicrobiales bacterium]
MVRTALAIRHVAFEDLGILHTILATRGYHIDYLEAGVDPLPDECVQNANLLIILGGPVGVYDQSLYPFLRAELDAVAKRLETDAPTLGICLGAQLMARALGAEVRATGRKEIGYGPLTLTRAGRDSVLAPLDGIPVLHWHGDQFDIPSGAARLAETPGFPNQAFSIGPNHLALQFHLEADHTQIERWLIGHAVELAAAGIDPNAIRDDAGRFGPVLVKTGTAVLNAWLGQLELPSLP